MNLILSLTMLSISTQTLRREAIHRLTADRCHWYSQYDYIVVGAGSAGCVVANRLSADHKHTVLLLEAGGPQSALFTDIPGLNDLQLLLVNRFWKYFSVKQKNAGHFFPTGIPEPKGKQLGGTSAVNFMDYNRGNRKDFDNLVKAYGAYGWSYAEVLPLFIKSENNSDQSIVRMNPGFHGTDGPLSVSSPKNVPLVMHRLLEVYNALGYKTVDVNGRHQLGTAIAQSTIKDGLRASTASAYIDPNPHPNSLHILTKAFVTKILIRKSMNKLIAFGVEFIKDKQLYRVVANKEVILSAGPINSPQLLMLSGIGPKEHLNDLNINVLADLPVGNNYYNHITVPIIWWVNTKRLDQPMPDMTSQQLSELYSNKTSVLDHYSTAFLFQSTRSNPDQSWPNVLTFTHQLTHFIRNLMVTLPTLVRPRSKGTVRLQSANPYTSPLIDPQFLTHPQDMDDFVDAIKFMHFVLTDTPFAKYAIPIKIPFIGCHTCAVGRPVYYCNQYIRCLIRQIALSFAHPVGTCRMGSVDRSDVVVSERLRVKNALNLRVCDSSIYPEPINANTNAASILVGEKCAQMVREDDLYYGWEAKNYNTTF